MQQLFHIFGAIHTEHGSASLVLDNGDGGAGQHVLIAQQIKHGVASKMQQQGYLHQRDAFGTSDTPLKQHMPTTRDMPPSGTASGCISIFEIQGHFVSPTVTLHCLYYNLY